MSGKGGGKGSGSRAAALDAMAARVREASRLGELVPLAEVWAGPREDLELALSSTGGAPGPDEEGTTGPDITDLRLVARGPDTFLYSARHMTARYAETALRVAAGDVVLTIAGTVREDSATYPRPTPLDAFLGAPFRVAPGALEAAVAALTADRRFADIRVRRASDGSTWLYSADHLTDAHAVSLIEWMAVGRFENP